MDTTRAVIRQILTEDELEVLYHVTHTELADKIKAEGLRTMQTSNWLQRGSKERYGEGQVFAFENRIDAIRWAARMDWEFNQATGSGSIAIVTFKPQGEWLVDDADPMSQAMSLGDWFKSYAPQPPESIISVEPVTQDVVQELMKADDERLER
jgi:hypothetical protein